jgi:hypothetical protein
MGPELVLPKGKMRGVYFGRDAIKTQGPGDSDQHFRILQGNDGFGQRIHSLLHKYRAFAGP